MTSKEKAKELVHKFYGSMNPNAPDCNISYNQAKECALIVVDEIMLTLVDDPWSDEDYWQEVKQEILSL